MIARNKLFILPTNRYGADGAFCEYTENKKEQVFSEIDINKGYAKQSLKSLVKGAQAIIFSGGEPLLNMNILKVVMDMEKNKRFIITTNVGKSLEKLEADFEMINEICKKNNSTCAIRISLNHFLVDQINYEEKISQIIKWFFDLKWEACNSCFFRATFMDKELVGKIFSNITQKEHWEYRLIEENDIITKAVINGKEFRITMKNTINPEEFEIADKYDIAKYLDIMENLHTNSKFYLSKSQIDEGLFGKNEIEHCDLIDDFDVTITSKGDVYLYGSETSTLGNIYEEHITFELLKERMKLMPEYEILQSHSIREIIEKIFGDDKLGELVKKISNPFFNNI